MATNQYQGKKIDAKDTQNVNDELTVEGGLQININNKPFSLTMRTPGDDEELIRGLLYSEDIYRGEETLNIKLSETENNIITEANINIDENLIRSGYSNSRNFLSASSCGICGKTELQEIDSTCKLTDESKIDINTTSKMFKEMSKHQKTFQSSGGSHATGAFTLGGELICVREDIGRHNAVDKVIGYLVNKNQLSEAKCLTVSGRISYEIVSKAFAAKIPILAAVSAPSSLAVDFAKELGITLFGFCRESKATCYSHTERVTFT